MFSEDSNGAIYYATQNYVYSLLEGKDNKGYTSDIVFIYREPKFEDVNVEVGEVVDFVYGGFDHFNRDYIENAIKKYEERRGLKNDR